MIIVEKEEVKNGNKIGTYFNKDNIFVGVVSYDKDTYVERIRKENFACFKDTSDEQLKALIDLEIIDREETDLFYLSENGYTCFNGEIETIVGDNSDGKGTIKELVSAWDYFDEDELYETIENGIPVIVSTSIDPLLNYNSDYECKLERNK